MKRKGKGKGKGMIVGSVDHGPFHVDIHVDSETGKFFCEYGDGVYFTSASLPEVRSWARETLRDLGQIKWQPVMEVHLDDEDGRTNNLKNCSNIECHIERGYIGWDGHEWRWTHWVVMPPGSVMVSGPQPSELEQSEYPMPEEDLMAERVRRSRPFVGSGSAVKLEWPIIDDSVGGKIYWVEYTEERWRAMLNMLDKMRELRGGINRLLSSEQGWVKLGKMAQSRLLPTHND